MLLSCNGIYKRSGKTRTFRSRAIAVPSETWRRDRGADRGAAHDPERRHEGVQGSGPTPGYYAGSRIAAFFDDAQAADRDRIGFAGDALRVFHSTMKPGKNDW